MELNAFCDAMGFPPDAHAILLPQWREAVTSSGELPDFLSDEYIVKYYPLSHGDPALLPQLLEVAAVTRANPAAKLYAWVLYRGFFLAEPGNLRKMPLPEKVFGEQAGLFQFLVALGGFPRIEAACQKLGIPHEYVVEMGRWLGGTIKIFESGHQGLPGHHLGQTHWMRHYMDGQLFRIGRFEYLIHSQPDWSPAIYRRRADGQALALCRDGWLLDADGYRTADESGRKVTLELRDGQIHGTPITPLGRALTDKRLALDLNEWEAMATPWDWVPSVHIPVGGGMNPEIALESLKEAKAFFRKYFNRDIRLFVCGSWILNPDWEQELPDSNLAKFMRMLYLVPAYLSSGRDGLFFIFGRDQDEDWSNYPADNSMRRAFHRIRESGRKLRSNGMFVFADDLDRLDDGFYRNHWNIKI